MLSAFRVFFLCVAAQKYDSSQKPVWPVFSSYSAKWNHTWLNYALWCVLTLAHPHNDPLYFFDQMPRLLFVSLFTISLEACRYQLPPATNTLFFSAASHKAMTDNTEVATVVLVHTASMFCCRQESVLDQKRCYISDHQCFVLMLCVLDFLYCLLGLDAILDSLLREILVCIEKYKSSLGCVIFNYWFKECTAMW